MERKTLHKWFWAWEFEKEEQWLNAMASSGWLLDGVGWCTYHFVVCEPGTYTVRLEMRDRDENYIDFMQETGAEYVGRVIQWIYFRKKTEYGEFDIFSDLDSKISHLSKIGKGLAAIGFANLAVGIVNSINPYVSVGWINLLCATLLMYGLGRIHEKKEALERSRMLLE